MSRKTCLLVALDVATVLGLVATIWLLSQTGHLSGLTVLLEGSLITVALVATVTVADAQRGRGR